MILNIMFSTHTLFNLSVEIVDKDPTKRQTINEVIRVLIH